MKRLLQLSLVAAAVLTLASCGKERYSSGPYITEYRSVDADYQELDIDGAMSVEIAQDVDYDVKIETGERRMEYIHTDVIGNTLRIYEENNRVIKDKAVRVSINFLPTWKGQITTELTNSKGSHLLHSGMKRESESVMDKTTLTRYKLNGGTARRVSITMKGGYLNIGE